MAIAIFPLGRDAGSNPLHWFAKYSLACRLLQDLETAGNMLSKLQTYSGPSLTTEPSTVGEGGLRL
jgi:hypothetical protein